MLRTGGPLGSYNSLCDEHLAEYYSNPKRLTHLKKMGLISSDGHILDENVVRLKLARREQSKRARLLLAETVVSKAIELERKRRIQIKQRLSFLSRIEKVEKVKKRKYHPAGIQEFNLNDISAPDPESVDLLYKSLEPLEDQLSSFVGSVSSKRVIPLQPRSPYLDHSILYRTFGMPVPKPRPPSVPPASSSMSRKCSTIRNSALSRPHTAPLPVRKLSVTDSDQIHSNVKITLCFVGKRIFLPDGAAKHGCSQVMVLQQHCGGNTVTLFKDSVNAKDNFGFVSKRHIGNPFGLSIYLDGLIDARVSTCCEYRHACGKILGSKSAHFRLVSVERGKPCYRCEDEKKTKERFTGKVSSSSFVLPEVPKRKKTSSLVVRKFSRKLTRQEDKIYEEKSFNDESGASSANEVSEEDISTAEEDISTAQGTSTAKTETPEEDISLTKSGTVEENLSTEASAIQSETIPSETNESSATVDVKGRASAKVKSTKAEEEANDSEYNYSSESLEGDYSSDGGSTPPLGKQREKHQSNDGSLEEHLSSEYESDFST